MTPIKAIRQHCLEIPLTQGRVALVDNTDFEWLSKWKWYAQRNKRCWYAARGRRKEDGPGPHTIWMHRVVLGAPTHLEIDHKNANGLDNQRTNLRLATQSLNSGNRHHQKKRASGLPMGVEYRAPHFRARIGLGGRMLLGTFDTPAAAHAAYLAARAKRITEEEDRLDAVLSEKCHLTMHGQAPQARRRAGNETAWDLEGGVAKAGRGMADRG